MLKMNKIPLKIGIQLDPPALVYIYKESRALRMRRMPVRNFWSNTDIDFVLEDIRNRHGEHIQDIPDRAIRKMLNILKQHKQGKSITQILGTNGNKKSASGEILTEENDAVFDKLKENVRGSSIKSPVDSSKENDQIRANLIKKKEFPQRTTFATLYDTAKEKNKISENIPDSSNDLLLKNKKNNSDFQHMGEKDALTKRPTTLELENYELSTSFNTYGPQVKKTRSLKSGFLQELEKDLAEIELPEKEKPDELVDRTKRKIGSTDIKENEESKYTSNNTLKSSKKEETSKSRNEDDTDVEFDESDNPLDDPEEDFW